MKPRVKSIKSFLNNNKSIIMKLKNVYTGDTMQINTFKSFTDYISRGINNTFLIYGQEKKLIKQSVEILYKSINQYPELNLIILTGDGITEDNIVNSCETIPFLSEKKLVHIKNPEFLKISKKSNDNDTKRQSNTEESDLSEDAEKIGNTFQNTESGKEGYSEGEISTFLSKYINTLPDYVILLITYDGDINLKNKVAITVKNTGCLVQYNLLKARELEDVAYEMFKGHGKNIRKSELTYFVSGISSIEELEKEIEKICAYAMDENTITRDHIEAVMHKNLESNIFKMVDCISKKNADAAVAILNMLLFQGENYLKILAMITRQFRMTYLIKYYMASGKSSDTIKLELKIKNDGLLKNFMYQARLFNEEILKKALNLCLDTDFKIKSGEFAPDLALEMLIVNLCK